MSNTCNANGYINFKSEGIMIDWLMIELMLGRTDCIVKACTMGCPDSENNPKHFIPHLNEIKPLWQTQFVKLKFKMAIFYTVKWHLKP